MQTSNKHSSLLIYGSALAVCFPGVEDDIEQPSSAGKSRGKASRQWENPLPSALCPSFPREYLPSHERHQTYPNTPYKGGKIWGLALNTKKVPVNAFFPPHLIIFMVLFCSSLFALAAQRLI